MKFHLVLVFIFLNFLNRSLKAHIQALQAAPSQEEELNTTRQALDQERKEHAMQLYEKEELQKQVAALQGELCSVIL